MALGYNDNLAMGFQLNLLYAKGPGWSQSHKIICIHQICLVLLGQKQMICFIVPVVIMNGVYHYMNLFCHVRKMLTKLLYTRRLVPVNSNLQPVIVFMCFI